MLLKKKRFIRSIIIIININKTLIIMIIFLKTINYYSIIIFKLK